MIGVTSFFMLGTGFGTTGGIGAGPFEGGTLCFGDGGGGTGPTTGETALDLAAVGGTSSVFTFTTHEITLRVGAGALAFLGVSGVSKANSRLTEGLGGGVAIFPSSTDVPVDDLDNTVAGDTLLR